MSQRRRAPLDRSLRTLLSGLSSGDTWFRCAFASGGLNSGLRPRGGLLGVLPFDVDRWAPVLVDQAVPRHQTCQRETPSVRDLVDQTHRTPGRPLCAHFSISLRLGAAGRPTPEDSVTEANQEWARRLKGASQLLLRHRALWEWPGRTTTHALAAIHQPIVMDVSGGRVISACVLAHPDEMAPIADHSESSVLFEVALASKVLLNG
jgi:hypothetical protein